MTDEKNAAEPSGASGGSLANEHSARKDAEAKIIADGIAEIMRIASEPEWIPVTERLPGRSVHVIARCRGGQAMEYLYADGRFFRHGEERRVTHWQHFPEPPQDDE